MKVIFGFVFINLIAFLSAIDPKTVNIELETELQFRHDDRKTNAELLKNMNNVIKSIKSVLNKDYKHRRSRQEKSFLTFLNKLIELLKTYNDNMLKKFVKKFAKEIRNYHYKGCKFYEIIHDSMKRDLGRALDGLERKTAEQLNSDLNLISYLINDQKYANFTEYFNSLYPEDMLEKMDVFLEQLYKYRDNKISNLTQILRDGLRDILFDHVSDLNQNVRLDLKNKLEELMRGDTVKRADKARVQDRRIDLNTLLTKKFNANDINILNNALSGGYQIETTSTSENITEEENSPTPAYFFITINPHILETTRKKTTPKADGANEAKVQYDTDYESYDDTQKQIDKLYNIDTSQETKRINRQTSDRIKSNDERMKKRYKKRKHRKAKSTRDTTQPIFSTMEIVNDKEVKKVKDSVNKRVKTVSNRDRDVTGESSKYKKEDTKVKKDKASESDSPSSEDSEADKSREGIKHVNRKGVVLKQDDAVEKDSKEATKGVEFKTFSDESKETQIRAQHDDNDTDFNSNEPNDGISKSLSGSDEKTDSLRNNDEESDFKLSSLRNDNETVEFVEKHISDFGTTESDSKSDSGGQSNDSDEKSDDDIESGEKTDVLKFDSQDKKEVTLDSEQKNDSIDSEELNKDSDESKLKTADIALKLQTEDKKTDKATKIRTNLNENSEEANKNGKVVRTFATEIKLPNLKDLKQLNKKLVMEKEFLKREYEAKLRDGAKTTRGSKYYDSDSADLKDVNNDDYTFNTKKKLAKLDYEYSGEPKQDEYSHQPKKKIAKVNHRSKEMYKSYRNKEDKISKEDLRNKYSKYIDPEDHDSKSAENDFVLNMGNDEKSYMNVKYKSHVHNHKSKPKPGDARRINKKKVKKPKTASEEGLTIELVPEFRRYNSETTTVNYVEKIGDLEKSIEVVKRKMEDTIQRIKDKFNVDNDTDVKNTNFNNKEKHKQTTKLSKIKVATNEEDKDAISTTKVVRLNKNKMNDKKKPTVAETDEDYQMQATKAATDNDEAIKKRIGRRFGEESNWPTDITKKIAYVTKNMDFTENTNPDFNSDDSEEWIAKHTKRYTSTRQIGNSVQSEVTNNEGTTKTSTDASEKINGPKLTVYTDIENEIQNLKESSNYNIFSNTEVKVTKNMDIIKTTNFDVVGKHTDKSSTITETTTKQVATNYKDATKTDHNKNMRANSDDYTKKDTLTKTLRTEKAKATEISKPTVASSFVNTADSATIKTENTRTTQQITNSESTKMKGDILTTKTLPNYKENNSTKRDYSYYDNTNSTVDMDYVKLKDLDGMNPLNNNITTEFDIQSLLNDVKTDKTANNLFGPEDNFDVI